MRSKLKFSTKLFYDYRYQIKIDNYIFIKFVNFCQFGKLLKKIHAKFELKKLISKTLNDQKDLSYAILKRTSVIDVGLEILKISKIFIIWSIKKF